jgi:preprotein translocase subunit SecE
LADTAVKAKRTPLKWFKEARAEFKKVTWPTPKQTLRNTLIVLCVLTVAGAAIWGLDQGLAYLFRLMLGVS